MTSLTDALGVDFDMVAKLITTLREREETVSTAESLTGGLVCAVLTAVPGASAVVHGGLIAYSIGLKAQLAGVDGKALYDLGPVHPYIAKELAEGARERCFTTWGIGLTGVAGPDPQGGVEPGTVHIAVDGPVDGDVRTIRVKGGRDEVRAAAVDAALKLLARRLNRKSRKS